MSERAETEELCDVPMWFGPPCTMPRGHKGGHYHMETYRPIRRNPAPSGTSEETET